MVDGGGAAEVEGVADPVREFAERLRQLQIDAGGPSVRELVRLTERVGAPYTRGTIQDKLTGRSVAPWEFVAAFVRACALHAGGEPDLSAWRAWHGRMERDLAAQRTGRRRVVRKKDVCPYRGLEAFTAEHSGWFCGRDEAVERLVTALAGQHRGVLLLGPSGSGKSSLVQAGLLPALAAGRLPGSDQWITVVTRPGKDLFAELENAGLPDARTQPIAAAVASRLAADPAATRVLLVIDQFEELLTPSATDGSGVGPGELVDRLMPAIGAPGLSMIVVLRDDFYPQLASQALPLLEALSPGLNVPATLSAPELEEIVNAPARAVGLELQDGLSDRIVADVLAADPAPNAVRRASATVLPLIELTLHQLWHRRREDGLTHDAYQRIGGITGVVTTWCDNCVEQLAAEQQPIARRILTALVRPADESHQVPAVRQQVPLSALHELAGPGRLTDQADGAVDEVLGVLTDQRIITVRTAGHPGGADLPVAELVHEALIRDWPALREWAGQDHRFQDWLRRAGERHARWAARHDSGELLHGSELAEGLDWAAQRGLPQDIARLVDASRAGQQAAIRRARRLNAILAGLLALALVAAGLALWQRQTARAAQRTALSRQLAAQSSALIGATPDLASLLALQAYRASPTTEASAAVYAAAALPLAGRLAGHTGEVTAVAFSPDGRTLATGSADETVRLWDVPGGRARATLTGHTGAVNAVAFSPDGRRLAAAGTDRTILLWDTDRPPSRTTLTRNAGRVSAVAFSPDGRTLASGGSDSAIQLWDVGSGRERATLAGHTDGVSAVAFSPDGRTLATGSADRTARLWDVAGGQPRAALRGHTGAVYSVAFSPDGRTIGTGGADGSARLWDVGGRPRATIGGLSGAVVMTFSPDGRTIVTADAERAHLWDAETGQPGPALTGQLGETYDAVFSPDGGSLATVSAIGLISLFDLPSGQVRAGLDDRRAYSLAFSPDGRTLAAGGTDSVVRLWDVAGGLLRATLTGYTDTVFAVAFSPDGRTLATGGDSTVRLWDVDSWRLRATLSAGTGTVTSARFSPDGHLLASGSTDGTATLWDVDAGRARSALAGPTGEVNSVAFSPDGRTLATGDSDNAAYLWDVPAYTLTAAVHKICASVRRDLTADERATYLPASGPAEASCP